MKKLIEKLQTISAGKVLDVGVGRGQFAWIMAENFKDYDEILGVDMNSKMLEKAKNNLSQFRVRLEQMDGNNIEFDDNSFDTVSIAQVLHHIPSKEEIYQILSEMKRVLKPGGLFIIKEMFSDNHEGAYKITVDFHHWIAEIDGVLGKNHFKTFKKQEIIDIANKLNLNGVEISEFLFDEGIDTSENRLENFTNKIDKRIESVRCHEEFEELKEKGEAIRKRALNTGIGYEKEVIIIGTK
ncbi:class I SAM-dependent methyltransferase [Oceanirhabdus seepicola]|uniref:Methyltransferase domain-containing protein n=1 Tax=Oceanirhabdus seepicola TaxID=2828781 RepID=A0A9J6P8D5_9CLOT|nr:class I SAM-dependent methyltransferase [Oceanirhabdus seepicola]MCM1991712.1 methyltransferase domain-containing protein [Oceanirhabdus seepicola]